MGTKVSHTFGSFSIGEAPSTNTNVQKIKPQTALPPFGEESPDNTEHRTA